MDEKEEAEDGKVVYVNWLVDDLNRVVEARGCFKSIHGPFNADDDWTRRVFQL